MMSTTGELDVEVSHEREDGELEDSDVEDGTYIPLARPETFNPPSLVNMQIQDELSEEASASESSESDSDGELRRHAKRTKLRPRKPQQQQGQPNRKEKYNVWCKALQEDLLTEDMISCDVSKKSTLGVESYDYSIKYRLNDNYLSNKQIFSNTWDKNHRNNTNKRSHKDRSNIKLRLGKRVNSHRPHEEKQRAIILPDLITTIEDPIDTIAFDIADKLGEVKKDLISQLVRALGASKAIEIYKATQRIEAEGGMLIMNCTRRRTPGGIYFFLLKRDDDVSQDVINDIFNEDRKNTARQIKRARSKSRQTVMEELKQSLTDAELPSLVSRGEATVQSEHGSNPPPSPATDARDCSSDTDGHCNSEHPPSPSPAGPTPPPPSESRHQLIAYDDDDYLEVMCNEEMDLF